MENLTGTERIGRILKRQPVDRVGLYEDFWTDTHKEYVSQGHISENENMDDHFDFDMRLMPAFDCTIDLDYKNEIVEEKEDTVLIRDGNGALLRRHKKHDTTPEHVDYNIKERKQWEEVKEHLTKIDLRRINFEGYRAAKKHAKDLNKFFCWSGINVFEQMHPVCGHENLLVGMALDPEWIEDMVKVYSELNLALQEILFEKEGYPDGIWYYEDMGFKNRPFMSPAMYKELIFPAHKNTFAYAHSKNLPVIVHSCGFVEPLLPDMIEAGMDCLEVLEVKAGMDMLRVYKNYGDKISLMGGIDVRKLYTNDKKQIDEELEAKIPVVMQNNGYILHSDHSIPKTVNYDTTKYFFDRGKEIGTYR